MPPHKQRLSASNSHDRAELEAVRALVLSAMPGGPPLPDWFKSARGRDALQRVLVKAQKGLATIAALADLRKLEPPRPPVKRGGDLRSKDARTRFMTRTGNALVVVGDAPAVEVGE